MPVHYYYGAVSVSLLLLIRSVEARNNTEFIIEFLTIILRNHPVDKAVGPVG